MASELGPLLCRGKPDGHVVAIHDLLDVLAIPANDLAMESFRKVKRCLGRKLLLQYPQGGCDTGDAFAAYVEGEEAVT